MGSMYTVSLTCVTEKKQDSRPSARSACPGAGRDLGAVDPKLVRMGKRKKK